MTSRPPTTSRSTAPGPHREDRIGRAVGVWVFWVLTLYTVAVGLWSIPRQLFSE